MANSLTESHALRVAPSDEIDLLGLFRSIGRTWKYFLVGVILVSTAYAGWLSLKILTATPNSSVYKIIKLTFVGVDKGTYPNGALFQLEDIVAPVILYEVFEKHDLAALGITVEEFRRSLSVEPYAPTYALIVDRYKKLLNNSNLALPEVEDIERRMSTELANATNGAVMLTMRLGRVDLPSEFLYKVLSDLPAAWARYSIANKGVLDLDIELASAMSIDQELIKNVDYMVISHLLQEKTGLVEANIRLLSDFGGAATLKDPETGMRLADLKQALEDLRRYVIDDLMSPVRSLGLTRNRDLSLYYYEDLKQRLTEDVQLLQRRADLVREAFEKYSLRASSAAPSIDGAAYSGGAAELSAGALDKVLDMHGDSRAEEYRQRLNRQWLDINIQATDVQNRVDEVNRLITALQDGQSRTSDALREKYLIRTEDALPKILDRISAYLDITQRIYRQLSKESIGVNGRLYEPISNQPFTEKFPIDIKRELLVWVALLFIMTIFIVPSVMLSHSFRKRRMG